MKNLAWLSLVVAPFVVGCDITTSDGSGSGGTYSSPTTATNGENGMHSSNRDVSQMRASMSAQSDGTTISIYASVFDVDTDEPITLDTGDFFTATAGSGDPLVLVMEPYVDAFSVHYAATMPAGAGAQDVTIAFVRRSGQRSAPNSIIHVPAPFSIVSKAPASVAYGDDLSVQVSPVPSDDIEVQATGDCLIPGTGTDNINTYEDAVTFDPNGNGTFSTQWLSLGSSSNSCAVSIYFVAIHDGTLDPAFAGGVSGSHDVEGTQTRGVQTIITQTN